MRCGLLAQPASEGILRCSEGILRCSGRDVQLGTSDGAVSFDSNFPLDNRRATDPVQLCSLQEAMRLLPVAGEGSFRYSGKDVRLGNLTVPSGIFIWAFFLGTFTHPDLWDDPDDFRPVGALNPKP